MTRIDKCYQELANAIVLQAVKDYRKSLQFKDKGMIRRCEKFFQCEWFRVLTSLDGLQLMKRLQMEAEPYEY